MQHYKLMLTELLKSAKDWKGYYKSTPNNAVWAALTGLMDIIDDRGSTHEIRGGGQYSEMEAYIVELFYLKRGVQLVLDDQELVDAIMRTEYNCTWGDIRFPFPSMELVIPDGIKVGNSDIEHGGILVTDIEELCKFDLVKAYKAPVHWDVEGGPMPDPAEVLDTYFGLDNDVAHADWRDDVRHYDMQSRCANPVGHSKYILPGCGVNRRHSIASEYSFEFSPELGEKAWAPGTGEDYLCGMRKIVAGVLLYIQSAQSDRVMNKVIDVKRSSAVPKAIRKSVQTIPTYKLMDIVSRKPLIDRTGIETGIKHATPKTHWRAGCFKVLKHERYQRAEDGKPKVIWTRPCVVNANEEDTVRAFRKVV